jgi:hypothetical protein
MNAEWIAGELNRRETLRGNLAVVADLIAKGGLDLTGRAR